MTLQQFIADRAKETYPEPRTEGHDAIIAQVCPMVAAKLKPGADILDVGCGQGPAMEWFIANGFNPLGTTMNLEDAKVLQAKNLRWTREDMHSMDFGDESFDCVFARHVIEHSIAPFYVLHEFHRILKPGGVLYVEVPAPDTSCMHDCGNANHYSVMGVRMWGSLIHRAGFPDVTHSAINLATDAGADAYFLFIATKPINQ